jgi:signal transduction histidine kinase
MSDRYEAVSASLKGRVACLEELLAVQEQVVTDQTRLLHAERDRLCAAEQLASASATKAKRILDMAYGAVLCLDQNTRIGDWSESAAGILGLLPTDRGKCFHERVRDADEADRFQVWYLDKLAGTGDEKVELTLTNSAGRPFLAECRITVNRLDEECVAILFFRDVTDEKRKDQEWQQAQKLESVGRLAAGIAHEINTPVQFVSDSIEFISDAINDLFNLVGQYRTITCAHLSPSFGPRMKESDVAQIESDADLDYLREQLPQAVETSREGLSRVATIVRSMKEFAHPDDREKVLVDLNHAVESTLTIARSEYKYVAELETEFAEIPPVTCHPGDLNQAILNIIINAAHAIGDVVAGSDERGRITVRTLC